MNESRDSEYGTVEKEEVIAGESDAHTSNEGSERYGVGHVGGAEQRQSWETDFPHLLRQRSRAQRSRQEEPNGPCHDFRLTHWPSAG